MSRSARSLVDAEHSFWTKVDKNGPMPETYTGKASVNVGESHGMSKLTQQSVVDIRKRYAEGNIKQSELAVKYGVCPSQISHIISGKNWRRNVSQPI